MRKLIGLTGLFLFLNGVHVLAQEFGEDFDNENVISGNLGTTTVGGQTFVGFRIQPEFSFGKIGVGLDVPLLFNTESGELRTEEFERGSGILRMFRYVRYGRKKQDPVYVKLGDMTGERLGYGALLGSYSNAVSFERRKVGLSADLLFAEQYGLEALYSDLNFDGSQKLLAVRPYYKPFGKTEIPIVKTLEVGVSFISDKDDYEEPTTVNGVETVISSTTYTRDGNSAFGVDLGVILLKNALLTLTTDVQFAQLNKNDALADAVNTNPALGSYDTGSGFSAGIEANFKFVANVFSMNARLERQWYGDNYIPQFFNFAYEINKDARLLETVGAESSQGIYGRLGAIILDKVKIEGELILPDNLEDSGRGAIVGVNLTTKEIASFRARGKYVKAGLTDLGDSFKLDQRSVANLIVTKRLGQFFEVGVDYQWTFAEKEDGTFKAVNQVRPYVGFSYRF